VRGVNPAVVAAPEMTCKVLSDSEVEVHFRDNSTRRVAIPPAVSPSVAAARTVAAPGISRDSATAVTARTAREAGGGSVTRGFDSDGQPYVDEKLPDGSTKRTQRSTITITKPDGTKHVAPLMYTRSNTQAGTPPDLPADPQRGRGWVEQHNKEILAIISALVKADTAEMARFEKAEQAATGNDLFKKATYRTEVAAVLAGKN